VSAAVGAGNNYNQVVDTMTFWVGLHNSGTGHYSNGVLAGTVSTTSELSTITVANLDNLKYSFHDNNEKLELYYVIYATLDGGKVPYLVMNAAGTDVLLTAVTETSVSLSLNEFETDGIIRDLTAEMPIDNFPPRQMKTISHVQGRVYGVLTGSGTGDPVLQEYPDGKKVADFTYSPNSRHIAGIVYSKTAADIAEDHTVGAHEECWPVLNFRATPNGESPMLLERAPDGFQVLVLCPTSSYLVTENNVGLHDWTTVSDIHGIYNKECACVSDHGIAWPQLREGGGPQRYLPISVRWQDPAMGAILVGPAQRD
jgi:hypothetical protein